MDFDQYKQDVKASLASWLGTLQDGSRRAAEELKESTGDLIAGWKESFPRRQKEIDAFVNEQMEKFFKSQEKKGE